MKNKNPLQVLFASALFLVCLLQANTMMAQSQQGGPPCTNCSCGGGFFAGPCATGQCCNGTIAVCECYVWWNKCACTNGALTMPTITSQNESNIFDLSNYILSGGFSSVPSRFLAENLPTLIKASKTGNPTLYFETGQRLNDATRQLSANEKQLINDWIAARGGAVRIE